ncbi:MAG: hypothetical protein QF921_03630 [Pseudomonadales bacterium]|nr:hypothetical protein [Pseudomonadales bacterium]MDP6471607.1 hypothetical protein [Pseudomonadales bacterium]MDP6828870.1 hypothetical protein [Pseudomonadales bacterium]MDP6970598.1 hypothetical protein [Pseudomonadales bacterium]
MSNRLRGLDVFYLNTPLNRYQVIASKAITQTLGHVLKRIYYALIVGSTDTLTWRFYPVAMFTAIAGTRLLECLDDARFRKVSGWVILTIAAACLYKGFGDLLAPLNS